MMPLREHMQRVYDRVRYLGQVIWAVNPRVEPPSALVQLAEEVQEVLPLVSPPADFRRRLGSDLALAAQRNMAGITVEYPRSMRRRALFGLSAGALMSMLAIMIVLFHLWRSRGAEG